MSQLDTMEMPFEKALEDTTTAAAIASMNLDQNKMVFVAKATNLHMFCECLNKNMVFLRFDNFIVFPYAPHVIS